MQIHGKKKNKGKHRKKIILKDNITTKYNKHRQTLKLVVVSPFAYSNCSVLIHQQNGETKNH